MHNISNMKTTWLKVITTTHNKTITIKSKYSNTNETLCTSFKNLQFEVLVSDMNW